MRIVADENIPYVREAFGTLGDVTTMSGRAMDAAAVKDADFIYTDLWWWVGQEDEIPERRTAFMPTYQVNMELLKQAPAHCKVMHCLPAHRGCEITDEVADGKHSIIFEQAENRLHMQKAILEMLLTQKQEGK